MAKPEGVAELVHHLLQSAAAKALLVGVEIKPEQRNDAGFSVRLGNAKDEVQISGVQVDVGYGEHALSADRGRSRLLRCAHPRRGGPPGRHGQLGCPDCPSGDQ